MLSNHYFCLGDGTGFFDNKEEYNEIKTGRFFYEKNPIVRIGNDVRIGERSIIFSGVNICDGAIVYPGSVVDSDVEAFTIVAGNPAKVIGKRFPCTVEKMIERSNWYRKDLAKVFQNGRKNYLNTDYYTEKLCEFDGLPELKNNCVEIDTIRASVREFDYKIAVVGPSHVSNWVNLISSKKTPEVPFFLFGSSGLSIHGNTLDAILELLIHEHGMDVALMVPDFRIGNACLVSADGTQNALFIDPMLIGDKFDQKIFHMSLSKLDKLVQRYREKIKFIFWCLYGREQLNKQKGKYVYEKEVYRHPVWNYSELLDRYKENVIDISDLGEKIIEITEPERM